MPDYNGGSIVNMLSSIIRSRGGKSPHAELNSLRADALAGMQKVIYLVVDGLGQEQLDRYLSGRKESVFFAAHPYETISTVFPATTAAAVTTFATGASPAEHGILGWHLHLHDLGLVSTILPATTRTRAPMADKKFNLKKYLAIPSHLASAPCRRELLSWGHIAKSRFSRASSRWSACRSFISLEGMVRQAVSFARRKGRALAYAYWPDYDTLCHEYGIEHSRCLKHLKAVDRALAKLARLLEKSRTALLVTADHGLVDALPDRRIDLRKIPGFYDCLAVIPSGDARQAQCFVRPARIGNFLGLVKRHLSSACVCITGEGLLKTGVFGMGRAHPSLVGRIGDYVLLAKDGYAFASSLPGTKTEFNIANHGGMSKAEMRVPLYSVYC